MSDDLIADALAAEAEEEYLREHKRARIEDHVPASLAPPPVAAPSPSWQFMLEPGKYYDMVTFVPNPAHLKGFLTIALDKLDLASVLTLYFTDKRAPGFPRRFRGIALDNYEPKKGYMTVGRTSETVALGFTPGQGASPDELPNPDLATEFPVSVTWKELKRAIKDLRPQDQLVIYYHPGSTKLHFAVCNPSRELVVDSISTVDSTDEHHVVNPQQFHRQLNLPMKSLKGFVGHAKQIPGAGQIQLSLHHGERQGWVLKLRCEGDAGASRVFLVRPQSVTDMVSAPEEPPASKPGEAEASVHDVVLRESEVADMRQVYNAVVRTSIFEDVIKNVADNSCVTMYLDSVTAGWDGPIVLRYSTGGEAGFVMEVLAVQEPEE